MQLNDSREEDISEREPILGQSDSEDRFVESSSSCEIVTVGGDHTIIDQDLQNLHVDEICQLVNADQPQCRICLDSGGLMLPISICLVTLPKINLFMKLCSITLP